MGSSVRFTAARRPSTQVLEFAVEAVADGSEAVRGLVRITDPEGEWPPLDLTSELRSLSHELHCVVLAALGSPESPGPLRSTLQLRVGEETNTDAVAVVTEDPPPGPGLAATRVLWSHDRQANGIVLTYRTS